MKSLNDSQETRVDGLLTEEDLTQIEKKIYKPVDSELKARKIFSLKTDIDPGAETVSYDKISRAGAAKITANGADDIPLVDADMTRTSHGIVTLESGFKIKKQERRAARMAGKAVDTEKADIARRVISEKENDIVFTGDNQFGIEGCTNASGMLSYDVPQDSDSDGTAWEYKTGPEIIEDIRKARKKMRDLDGFEPDTLLLPPDNFSELERPYNEYNATTLMQYLNNLEWFDRIVEVSELEGSDPDTSNDSGLIIDTSERNMELVLPLDIMMHDPVTLANRDSQINLEERVGGLIIRYPQALCRIDGI